MNFSSPPTPPPQRGEGSALCPAKSPSPLAGEGGARPRSGWEGEGPNLPTREELLARAKRMRANPTEAERRLWALLRAKRLDGFKFKRQLIIYPYIVDFACLDRRLIIEADGSQHADRAQDARRDAFLRKQGFKLLRFWNDRILAESEAVGAAIYDALTAPLPSPPAAALPSPAEGRGKIGALHG